MTWNVGIKNPKAADGQKKALSNKIDSVVSQVRAGAYTGAIDKLEHDIRDKIEKWVVDPDRDDLIEKINLIIGIP